MSTFRLVFELGLGLDLELGLEAGGAVLRGGGRLDVAGCRWGAQDEFGALWEVTLTGLGDGLVVLGQRAACSRSWVDGGAIHAILRDKEPGKESSVGGEAASLVGMCC